MKKEKNKFLGVTGFVAFFATPVLILTGSWLMIPAALYAVVAISCYLADNYSRWER